MWTCGEQQGDHLSLRVGAALADMDAGDVWAACCGARGEEHVAFASVVEAVRAEDVDTRIWNIVAQAINARLHEQGMPPLLGLRPTADFA